MAQQKLDLQLRGLYTAPNQLSGVPAGSLSIADNVVINSKSLIESRRGQTQYGSPLTIGTGQINKLFNYSSSIIVNYDSKMAYDNGNGVWVEYPGTYNPPLNGFKMRSLEALKNFYFTTSKGIYKIDNLINTPKAAGVVRALGGTYTLTGSGGFLEHDSAVAYRIVWGYVDANNTLVLGSPSQRLIAQNASGGDKDVSLTFLIPDTITTNDFYQIYRSNGTANAADEPNDELQLIIQANPTAAEIAAKSFTFVDNTPYSLMRTTLYTSPSQQGIANANNPPPYAVDMDVFKTCAFYANTKQKQTLSLAIISVDNPSLGYYVDASVDTTLGSKILTTIADTTKLRTGMRAVGAGIPIENEIVEIISSTSVMISAPASATASVSVEFQDVFEIGGVKYYAGSSNDVAKNQFKVDNSGTPGENIDATAENLIQIVNTSASNTTLYAYYLSGLEDLPGQILFEERLIGGNTFYAFSSYGASFNPKLPKRRPGDVSISGNGSVVIASNSATNPTVISTIGNHGLTTGDVVTISGSNSVPSINGDRTVTVLTSTTFSIPVAVTVAGTTGSFVLSKTSVFSDNEAKENRVYVSKPSQVESVPVYRYFDIGSANFPIQRVVALRDGIFFFKTDGIYRISGETFESFVVTLVDNTVILKVPESAVAFNNQVYCFTTQGVCAVTDAGVKLISVPIENTLLELSSDQYTNFADVSFGVAYESARLYMFFTLSNITDTYANQAFVYNSLTDSWTRWVMDRTCGVVNSAVNKLFMAQPNTGQVVVERKSYTNDDYADEQYSVTIDTVDSDTQLTLSDASVVVAGMTIVRNDKQAYIIEKTGNVLTIEPTAGFTTGAATVYTPIENSIAWTPIDCENPGILKQFSEISLFFKNAAFNEIEASFGTNILTDETVTIKNNAAQDAWDSFGWGGQPWGGVSGGQAVLRTYVPRNQQRGSWMNLALKTAEAFTGFSLQGVSVMFNPMSSRQK